jgi:ferric iron reductase protein FhuF
MLIIIIIYIVSFHPLTKTTINLFILGEYSTDWRFTIVFPTWLHQALPTLQHIVKFGAIEAPLKNHHYALDQLLISSTLEQLLDSFAENYPGRSRTAIVSQWSMNYLSILLPATLISAIVGNRAFEIWQRPAVLIHLDNAPQSIHLIGAGEALELHSLEHYFHDLLDLHIAPLFSHLTKAGKISRSILWSNCAIVWHGLFSQAKAHPAFAQIAQQALNWWHNTELVRNTVKLSRYMKIVDSPVPELVQSLPVRSHCCLHYQLHEKIKGQSKVLCESCPKLQRLSQEQKIHYLREILQ